MTIEEYKEVILHNLGIASDCEAVEEAINRSIEKLKEKHIHAYLVAEYLVKLKYSLENLSPGALIPFTGVISNVPFYI